MDKTLIKVIRRKDTGAVAANTETRIAGERETTAAMSEEKTKRNLHRRIAKTISGWISELRENKRAEENSLVRAMFAEDAFPGKQI